LVCCIPWRAPKLSFNQYSVVRQANKSNKKNSHSGIIRLRLKLAGLQEKALLCTFHGGEVN